MAGRQEDDIEIADMSDEEVEERARRQGWVPEEEWDDERAEREGRRKPAKFKTAREYLETIENSLPVARRQNRDQDAQIRDLTRRLADSEAARGEDSKRLKEVGDLVEALHKESRESNKRAYEAGLAAAKQRKREALAENDMAAYDEANEAIRELEAKNPDKEGGERSDGKNEGRRQEERQPAKRPGAETDEERQTRLDAVRASLSPVARRWLDDNPWFEDPAKDHLNSYMRNQWSRLRREDPDADEAEILADAKAAVIRKFPEEFDGGNPRRRGNDTVGESRGASRRGDNDRSFASLPASSKDTFEGLKKFFESRGEKYTQADHARDYYAEYGGE